MRYLKYYESNNDFHGQLQDFCETSLAYLIDEGTEIDVIDTEYQSVLFECKAKIKIKFDDAKSWNLIKDHIIPFIDRLNSKYQISRQIDNNNADVRIHFFGSVSISTKVEDIINDNIIIPELYTKLSLDKDQITDMIIYIKGDKERVRKGFISKIKSFFK